VPIGGVAQFSKRGHLAANAGIQARVYKGTGEDFAASREATRLRITPQHNRHLLEHGMFFNFIILECTLMGTQPAAYANTSLRGLIASARSYDAHDKGQYQRRSKRSSPQWYFFPTANCFNKVSLPYSVILTTFDISLCRWDKFCHFFIEWILGRWKTIRTQ
jgi:hypothetical protein